MHALQPNDEVFTLHFSFDYENTEHYRQADAKRKGDFKRFDKVFNRPLVATDIPVKVIHVNKLTVLEHHKVATRWDDRKPPELCEDGYILKDDEGVIWHNQYPRAEVAQMSDEPSYMFERKTTEGDVVANTDKRSYYIVCREALTFLENIQTALDSPVLDAAKKAKLQTLKERILRAFELAYPDYTLTLSYESKIPGVTDPDFIGPLFTITKGTTNASS